MDGAQFEVQLLDGPRILIDGTPHTVVGRRQRQLLARLSASRGATVSTDTLIEDLWPDEQPKTARKSIQRFIADIRQALGPLASRLGSTPHGYRLELEPGECDLFRAEDSLERGRALQAEGDFAAAARHLGESLELLSRFDRASIDGTRSNDQLAEAIHEMRASVEEDMLSAHLSLGRNAEAVSGLQTFVIAHPYRERAWGFLMVALFRLGRQQEALETFQRVRRNLSEDLGIDPSPQLQAIETDILQHRVTEDAMVPRRPALGSPESRLIGRDDEVQTLEQLLHANRTVTLTGPGGVGKTELARHAARRWVDAGGVTRFASISDGRKGAVLAAIGAVVGVSPRPDADLLAEIVDRLAESSELFVIDNCDHGVTAIAELIELLQSREDRAGRLLLVSRVPVTEDSPVIRVKALDRASARTALRWHAGRLGVDLDATDDDIDRLCAHLDGLPLAIALAASMLQSLGVRQLADQWSASERPHAAIEAALSRSIEQLSGGADELLRFCATFEADFDHTALAVRAGSLEALMPLDQLVKSSLLRVDHHRGAARYRMLIPIREVVRTRDRDGEVDREDHAGDQRIIAHYAQVAERGLGLLTGPDPLSGIDLFRDELPALGAAFDLAESSDELDAMARMTRSFGLACGITSEVRGQSTLRDWTKRLDTAIALASHGALSTGTMMHSLAPALAWGHYGCGDGRWYTELLKGVGSADLDEATTALVAIAAFSVGDASTAWKLLAEVQLDRVPDPYIRTMLSGVGAVIGLENGDDRGHDLSKLASETSALHNVPGTRFFARMGEATQAFVTGDIDLMEVRIDQMRSAVDGHGLVTLSNMGKAAEAMCLGLLTGRRDPAPILSQLLQSYGEQNSLDPASVAMAIDTSILVLAHHGQLPAAAELLGVADRLELSLAVLSSARATFDAEVGRTPELRRIRLTAAGQSTWNGLTRGAHQLAQL